MQVKLSAHELDEYTRMAKSAYGANKQQIGDALQCAILTDTMPIATYDRLKSTYCAWLMFGWKEADYAFTRPLLKQ